MNFRAHKKKLVAAGLVLMLILGFATAPLAVKPAAELAIRSQGFPKAEIGSIRFLPSGIYIDKILLDPNGFSEINDVEIRGAWKDLILNRRAERVSAKEINLSGEIDNRNRLTFAGWDGKLNTSASGKGNSLPFNSLYLNAVTVDLDTPAGALRIQGKADLESGKNGRQVLNASIYASQQQLTTSIAINASRNLGGNFSGKADVVDTNIDIGPLTLSRLSGWVEFSLDKNISAAGQILAGGMKYNDMPFEDSNLAFDTSQETKAVFKTKATGAPVFFNASWISKPETLVSLELSGPSLSELASLGGTEKKKNDWLTGTGPVEIRAALRPGDVTKSALPVSANLLFQKKKINIPTSFTLNQDEKKISGSIPAVSLNAADLAAIFPLQEKFQFSPEQGKISFAGKYSFDYAKSPFAVAGPLDLRLNSVTGKIFDYDFKSLNGDLRLVSLYPWAIAPGQGLTLKSFNAGKELTDARFRFSGNGQKISFQTVQSNFAGGVLQIRPFIWNGQGGKNSFVMNLDKINLGQLTGDNSSFTATGSVSGTLPFRLDSKKIMIDNGVLKSDQPASLSYTPKELPAALQGNDARVETVRLALSNYRYDSLQITLDGDLNGNLKTGLTARGFSPAVENRAVNLNLNLEGALTAALRQALQPGQLGAKLQKQFGDRAK